jgi:hypothetical protein
MSPPGKTPSRTPAECPAKPRTAAFFEVDVQAVPEPATLLMFGTSIAAVARARLRRRR